MKVFFVNLQAGIPQLHYRLTFSLVHEIRCSIRGVLKNLSKFSDKHKEQSSGGVLSKDVLKKFTKKTSFSFSTKLQAGNLNSAEAAAGDSLQNKVFLKILQISLEKIWVEVSF